MTTYLVKKEGLLQSLSIPHPTDPNQPPLPGSVILKGAYCIHRDAVPKPDEGGVPLKDAVKNKLVGVPLSKLLRACREKRVFRVTVGDNDIPIYEQAAKKQPSSGKWRLFPQNGEIKIFKNTELKLMNISIPEINPPMEIKAGYISIWEWKDPRENFHKGISNETILHAAKNGFLGDFENGKWVSKCYHPRVNGPHYTDPKAKIKMGFGISPKVRIELNTKGKRYEFGSIQRFAKQGQYVRIDPITKNRVAGAFKNTQNKIEIWKDAFLVPEKEAILPLP